MCTCRAYIRTYEKHFITCHIIRHTEVTENIYALSIYVYRPS